MFTPIEDSASAKPLQGIHILVAEDTPLARTILCHCLPKAFEGSSISFVGCGNEAEKALLGKEYLATSPDGSKNWIEKAAHFDVAFLDHGMPEEMTGRPVSEQGLA